AHTGLHSPKRPAFQRGDTVMIEQGPLANLQAIVWGESGEERVMILLKILGRETAVTVPRDLLGLA
ncbi:MAG: transcription termination/antitermination protein NusG, partial [Gammaproteobacteria bacterium]